MFLGRKTHFFVALTKRTHKLLKLKPVVLYENSNSVTLLFNCTLQRHNDDFSFHQTKKNNERTRYAHINILSYSNYNIMWFLFL